MRDAYLSSKFSADLERLGHKASRKITTEQLDAFEDALGELAEGEFEIVLDSDARAYIRAMHERAGGKPLRAPDFEEVSQGGCWLADPAAPRTLPDSFDTNGGISSHGLLCLGEWTSGELWVLDICRKQGYVFLITEDRKVSPMFRGIGEFAQWAVANQLWKNRLQKDSNEIIERLSKLRLFRTVSHLREAGLVPQSFKPKRFRPLYDLPIALERAIVQDSD